jgi:hypothetical protein
LATAVTYVSGDPFYLVLTPRGTHHRRAGGGEGPCDAFANPATSTRDHGDVTSERKSRGEIRHNYFQNGYGSRDCTRYDRWWIGCLGSL